MDSPPVTLPLDDGDPKPVPGSVNSAPGDWNSAPTLVYKNNGSAWQIINALTLALDGTNGTFTAQTAPAVLGTWIESKCNGTWADPVSDYVYPIVGSGSFYRTEELNAFQWEGMEKIYPLALTAYDGSEQFLNHLIQNDAADVAGLATLGNGSPVLVDAQNPWTEEKLQACLQHLKTVKCRLQTVNSGAFDPSDTTAMARGYEQQNQNPVTPRETLRLPISLIELTFLLNSNVDWVLQSDFIYVRNMKFEFLDSLEALGFGKTKYTGYVGIEPPFEWRSGGVGYERRIIQPSVAAWATPGTINRTFQAEAGDEVWFMAGATNHNELQYRDVDFPYQPPAQINALYARESGYFPYDYDVLATLDLPAVSQQTLVMDMDRDGTISSNDWGRVNESHPYRFWVNADGNNAAFPEANLEDFFPAKFVVPASAGSNLTFKLSANVGLDYIATTMTTNDTDAYLTDLTVAGTLSTGSIPSLSAGTQTGTAYAENTILLLAATEADTTAEIYVHILQNGSEILVSTNHFSFSPVADMYRTKNLRAGGSSSTDEPANWPDELTNGKDFVFIHGFNVDEAAGHDWNADIFKRLWHSGSNARFNGVLWDGAPNSLGKLKHYHNAVVNAFATASNFAVYLNGLTDPVVMAHSLGNMVLGSAIIDHNANVDQYYAMNTAVALEAYGDSSPNITMVPDSLFAVHDSGWFIPGGRKYRWDEYPFESWASEWYRLFPEGDKREELTWRHRFLNIQQETDVFNFYSSTEDILRVDGGTTLLNVLDDVTVDVNLQMHFIPITLGFDVPYVWQLQEMYKGLDQIPFINAPGGGVSKYGGWGFVKKDSQHIDPRFFGLLGHAPVYPHVVSTALDTANADRDTYRASLQSDPLFRQEPEELFQSGALAFASGTVGTDGGNLEYNVGDNGMDISAVPIRDWLLAKAFPARTRPLGSTQNSEWDAQTGNFDMSTTYMTNPGQWYDQFDDYNGQPVWHHSDFRDAPYVHIYQLFEKIVTKEN